MKILDILNCSTLLESVTFSLDKYDDNDEYNTILDMSHLISRQFYNYVKSKHPFFYKHITQKMENGGYDDRIRFDADGDDYDQPTGTINVYPGNVVTEHFKADFHSALNHVVSMLGSKVTVGKMKIEGHKAGWDSPRGKFNDGDPVANIGVIRIPILKNDLEIKSFPELNIANANVKNLLDVLGLSSVDGMVGEISKEEVPRLIMRIRNLNDGKKNAMTRTATGDGDDIGLAGGVISHSGPRIEDQGVDASRVNQYLDRLLKVLQAAQKEGVGVTYG